MDKVRPYSHALDRLRNAGLRPTRQRLALAKLLFDDHDRHITAEILHGEALDAKVRVSLATVYNTLHQFNEAGLLREIVVDSGRSYFDTNTSDHHHIFNEDSRELKDIDDGQIGLTGMPAVGTGQEISRIDVIVRVKNS
jgi:Fur family iron response transcriptional regulator|tara:strand:- start:4841 stop:5257 length:417 start_codon:yes stop_codon:yes gene_type:complete